MNLNKQHIFIIPVFIIHAFHLFQITEQIRNFISNLTENKQIQKQDPHIMINQIANQQKLYSNVKNFSILQQLLIYKYFWQSRLEKNSLFPVLKTYLFSRVLQLPASKFGSPDLELLVSDSTVNKVVQQIEGG